MASPPLLIVCFFPGVSPVTEIQLDRAPLGLHALGFILVRQQVW